MMPSRDDLERIYRIATAEPFQFLYVDLRATNINEAFYIGFSKRICIHSVNDEMESDPFSNRTRDPVRGPVQGNLPQPAETVVMKQRGAQPRYGRESAIATPHQLQTQCVLRTTVPTGI